MATATPNMSVRLPEARAALQPSAAMAAFSQLLVALATLVEAERDLEHFDVWELATAHWLREAEEAFTRVTTLIVRVRDTVVVLPGDLALQRVALLLDRMIGSEEPGGFGQIHRQLHRFDGLFRHDTPGAIGQRVNALLICARRRIDEVATLSAFADEADIDEGAAAGMSRASCATA